MVTALTDQDKPAQRGLATAGRAERVQRRPLVSSPISQQAGSNCWHLYPETSKLKRPFTGPTPTPPTRKDTEIQGFSEKSRSRLRFVATNSRDRIRSQFGLTYHNHWPTDGRQFKRHLNTFLTAARRAFPFLGYLWVAEFQSRGVPHVHVFFDLPPTDENREILAGIWCRIVDPSDRQLLAFHRHPKNFISWTMGTGSYLCKYLDKAAQKQIPPGFHNFGAWWRNSRGLVPKPEVVTIEDVQAAFPDLDDETGEIHGSAWAFLVRTVGRYHEKTNRRSWFRRTNRSTSALTGAPVFRQALAYLRRTRNQGGPEDEPAPF